MSGSILLPIITAFQGKGVKDAISDLNKLGSVVGGVKKLLGGLGAATIAKGAFDFVKDSVLKARDYERELRALKTIFGTSAPEMEKFAKNSADIGLSTAESAKASVFLGSVLKQSGFTMGKVTEETKRLVGLASDLATVYGYDVSEALSGMTALFRGEYDPIEKFGVAMKQAEVNALLLERGQKNLTGGALRQAQAQARLDLLYQRSADSQGAFARGQGTLFVEQRNLSVAFENFQAQIAQALIPVLAKMMALIGDFVTRNGPLLTTVFEGFAEIVQTVFDELNADQAILDAMLTLFIQLVDIVKIFTVFILKHGAAIVILFLSYKSVIIAMKAWAVLQPIIVAATYTSKGAVMALSYAFDIMKVKAALATAGISLLVAGMALGIQAGIDHGRVIDDLTKKIRKYGVETGYTQEKINYELGNTATAYDDYVASLRKQLAELKKIDNYKDAVERRGIAHEAARLRRIQQLKDAKDAAEEFNKEVAKYKAGFGDLLSAVDPTAFATRTMGQFEAAVSGSFKAIYKKLSEGLASGFINGGVYDALRAYAKNESSVLGDIARKRDDFANRYSLAKTLIEDTTRTVQEFASLSNLLGETGQDLTKTVSYMVGKFKVTTSETVKSVTNAGTILQKYQGIVDATKKFAANVTLLKSSGLSDNLLNQIVAGGLDQGAALAEGLVAGGPDAIKAMNDSFNTLTDLGKSLGTTVATALYGDGVNLSKGLLEGLLDAEKDFADGGKTLADAFQFGFDNALKNGSKIPIINTSIYDALLAKYFPDSSKVDTSGMGSSSTVNTSGMNPYAEPYLPFGGSSVAQQMINNITINAGVGTDPISIGGEIVKYINKWAKVNNVAGFK
jgi:hypothetical protein